MIAFARVPRDDCIFCFWHDCICCFQRGLNFLFLDTIAFLDMTAIFSFLTCLHFLFPYIITFLVSWHDLDILVITFSVSWKAAYSVSLVAWLYFMFLDMVTLSVPRHGTCSYNFCSLSWLNFHFLTSLHLLFPNMVAFLFSNKIALSVVVFLYMIAFLVSCLDIT